MSTERTFTLEEANALLPRLRNLITRQFVLATQVESQFRKVRDARAAVRVPICAIGGIEPGHVGAVVRAGADLIAAIDGVFGAADVRAAAQAYVAALAAA